LAAPLHNSYITLLILPETPKIKNNVRYGKKVNTRKRKGLAFIKVMGRVFNKHKYDQKNLSRRLRAESSVCVLVYFITVASTSTSTSTSGGGGVISTSFFNGPRRGARR